MADTFKIYKKDGTKVAEGVSPLSITGIAAETPVAKGDYQAVRVNGSIESTKVDIPAFTTLAEQETASLKMDQEDKPTKSNTVDEIKTWLTEHNIDFAGVTLKDDLLALIPF